MVARVGVSDAVIEIITYIALGAVVALAGFIVFNELRPPACWRAARGNARARLDRGRG